MSNSAAPELSVVIPAYNEARRIEKTLRIISEYLAAQKKSYEILVINDGSRDKTAKVVEELKVPHLKLLSYERNGGKGYAVNFGVKAARGEWILVADADNSTPINELDKFWELTKSFPVLIGSRYLKESNITLRQPTPRVVLSRLGNLLTQLLILPGIKDTQCGFKLFQARAAHDIFSRQTIFGWGFDMELLRIARERGYRIREVPITWHNDEQSRIQTSRVFAKTLRELFTIKLNSMSGKYGRRKRSESEYILRFAFVGAIGTTLDFLVLNWLHGIIGVNLYTAVTTGFLVGALTNYILNSYLSFNQALTWRQLRLFLTIALVGLLLNNVIVYLLVEQAAWHYNLAKLTAVVVVFGWNYGLNRLITFRG